MVANGRFFDRSRIPFYWMAGLAVWVGGSLSVTAADYFVTIGGGYSPKGNQASMEANVKFFNLLLDEQLPDTSAREHQIYFSDGDDSDADVQVAERIDELSPTAQMIAKIFAWETEQVFYRNHEITELAGANRAGEIQRGLSRITEKLKPADRLFVYVTAHGGKSQSENEHDTSVYGWNREVFRSSEFSQWLTAVPHEVPVYMVMAQCYCGGFSHAIFENGDASQPLAEGLRCGFFAQQHDLPAAGCRPDISNDREYSSYFWGAVTGHSRTGEPITTADKNGDGRISLGEAHVYAVIAGDTIDIPFRSSEALLRVHSRIPGSNEDAGGDAELALLRVDGTLAEMLTHAADIDRWIVEGLAKSLEIPLDTPVAEIGAMAKDSRAVRRRGRGRGSYGRRAYEKSLGEVKDQLTERWPELTKIESIGQCQTMGISLNEIALEIDNWESYRGLDELVQRRIDAETIAENAELRQVKLKRMLQALETIALAKNLSQIADAQVQECYKKMTELELRGL